MKRALLLLVVLLSAGAFAERRRDGHAVPVKKGPFVDMRLVAGDGANEDNEDVIHVTLLYNEPGGMTKGWSWASDNSLPYEHVTLHAKFWSLLKDFCSNPSFTWKFRDKFGAKGAYLDREKLSKYPALVSRLRRATFSFDRVEVTLRAKLKDGSGATFNIKVPGVDFIIPNEGKKPIMAPGSPLRWTDMVTIDTHFRADPGEKGMPKLWSQIVSIEEATMYLVNFRVPWTELQDIAREYERREKEAKELEKEFAPLASDWKPPGVKPFAGGGPDAEPFEDPKAESFYDKEGKRVGLKSHGRVLVSWPSDKFRAPEPLAKGRYHLLYEYSRGYAVVDRNGKPRSFDGEDRFDQSWGENGKTVLIRTISRGESIEGACRGWRSGLKGQFFSSRSEPEGRMRPSAAESNRREEERWAKENAEKEARGDTTRGIVFCAPRSESVNEVRRVVLDENGKVLSNEHGYLVQ